MSSFPELLFLWCSDSFFYILSEILLTWGVLSVGRLFQLEQWKDAPGDDFELFDPI